MWSRLFVMYRKLLFFCAQVVIERYAVRVWKWAIRWRNCYRFFLIIWQAKKESCWLGFISGLDAFMASLNLWHETHKNPDYSSYSLWKSANLLASLYSNQFCLSDSWSKVEIYNSFAFDPPYVQFQALHYHLKHYHWQCWVTESNEYTTCRAGYITMV